MPRKWSVSPRAKMPIPPVGVRVRIAVGRDSVRRPTCVCNAQGRVPHILSARLDGIVQIDDFADFFDQTEGTVVLHDTDARGIVPTVLQSFETLDQDFARFTRPSFFTNVSDDSTHYLDSSAECIF